MPTASNILVYIHDIKYNTQYDILIFMEYIYRSDHPDP